MEEFRIRDFDDDFENANDELAGEISDGIEDFRERIHGNDPDRALQSNVGRGIPTRDFLPKLYVKGKHSRREKNRAIKRGHDKVLKREGKK